MFDCHDVTAAIATLSDDPRISGENVRCIPGGDGVGTVLLVGVVHDHPASINRVARVIEAVSPDVLALELPPLAIPLFQLYARDLATPPRLGGEMSMAIQAAGLADAIGIDGPNRSYLRTVLGRLVDGSTSIGVASAVLEDLVRSTAQALSCRVGALVGALTTLQFRVYSHIEYDTTLLDSPAEQATQEESYLSQQQSFLRAVTVPESVRIVDSAREESMVTRLRELRRDDDVAAVVGMEHLDTIEESLGTTR